MKTNKGPSKITFSVSEQTELVFRRVAAQSTVDSDDAGHDTYRSGMWTIKVYRSSSMSWAGRPSRGFTEITVYAKSTAYAVNYDPRGRKRERQLSQMRYDWCMTNARLERALRAALRAAERQLVKDVNDLDRKITALENLLDTVDYR